MEADPVPLGPSHSTSIYMSQHDLELLRSTYDRALTKQELCELLGICDLDLELLLVNELLTPSLVLEYHKDSYLGFFTYWDCLAALIMRVFLSHLRDLEAALELTEETLPVLAQSLLAENFSGQVDQASIIHLLTASLQGYLLFGAIPNASLLGVPVVQELATEITNFEERFRRLIAGAPPVAITPFAVNCLHQVDALQLQTPLSFRLA